MMTQRRFVLPFGLLVLAGSSMTSRAQQPLEKENRETVKGRLRGLMRTPMWNIRLSEPKKLLQPCIGGKLFRQTKVYAAGRDPGQ